MAHVPTDCNWMTSAYLPAQEAIMKSKQSDTFRDNAQNCADLAEIAKDEPTYQRYKRMEAAWRALADEQDWLDGERSPVSRSSAVPA